MRYVLTAQAEALSLALREAGGPRVVRTLEAGVALCEGSLPGPASRPVFLRHVCPADAEARLTYEASDIARIADAAVSLSGALSRAETFSVQTRILGEEKPAYQRFDVNTAVADRLIEDGFTLDVRAPARVVSVVIAPGCAYLGVSAARDNLSDWAGGCRRFKREADQISRAEFKLLEALEVFAPALPDGGLAVDLGAAPGGWTRVLRLRRFRVVAVDPALLDPRVAADPGVRHVQGTAQQYLKNPAPCDLLVNDMKMDAYASALLMVEAAPCLRAGGCSIVTLKLPDEPLGWPRRVNRALAALQPAYEVLGARQLFHNRCEVTACLTRKG